MINAYKLHLEMGGQVIFDDVSFTFDNTQRIGLVGRNGSGKSTLLKLLRENSPLIAARLHW